MLEHKTQKTNQKRIRKGETIMVNVGIIGAGTMGAGIAQAFAQTEGFTVVLCDINNEFAANGKKKIAKGFEKRKQKQLEQSIQQKITKIS